jgi:hypothetical protein
VQEEAIYKPAQPQTENDPRGSAYGAGNS